MHNLKYFIIIFVTFILSCNTSNKNKYDNESAPKDSSIAIILTVPDSLLAPNKIDKEGYKIGKWISFYDYDWNPSEYSNAFYYRKINYKKGKPHGKVCDYYKSGTLQWEGQLVSENPTDILSGKCNWYNSDGVIETRNYYINGIKSGKETSYYENGRIKTTCNYSKGTLTGKYTAFDLKGKIIQSGTYKNGQKIGKWRYYDSDGDCKITAFLEYRVGAMCNDGSRSHSTGRGTCSHHGGVDYWLVETEETIIGGTGKYSNHFY